MNIFQTAIILFYVSIGYKKDATLPIIQNAHGGQDAHAAVIHAIDYINPLPHVLMLTAIVVSVATFGVAMALAVRIYQRYQTLEEDELRMRLSEKKTMDNYPVLIVVAPLLAALFSGLAVWIEERLSYPIALTGLAISVFSAFNVLLQVITSGPIQYRMAGWAPPMGIEYRIDLLNAMVLLLVSSIGFLNLVASYKSV
jgi:multisubunit Na+/H+ antiporter MnhC subunit